MPPSPLLTPEEAAAFFGVSLGTIYNWSYRREIPRVKVGGKLRFRADSLEAHARKLEEPARRAAFDTPLRRIG